MSLKITRSSEKSLGVAPVLQRQVEKIGKELFFYWTLSRNTNMPTTILQRFTSSCGNRCFASCDCWMQAYWQVMQRDSDCW